MKYLEVRGGRPLSGTVRIQGSKNAVLPILTACLLGDGGCVIQNCPVISDVKDLLSIMHSLGCEVHRTGNTVTVNAENIGQYEVNGAEASRIRSSVLFLGALLGKMGKVQIPVPGGCMIGKRPVDLHLYALEQLGARTVIENRGEENLCEASEMCAENWIRLEAEKLYGAQIHLAFPSVGATENAILAAVLADGNTLIHNAAREPEIEELCSFLNLRGARIKRLSNGDIHIQGVKKLRAVTYQMRADRIVAGTYLLTAAATGGNIQICNFPWEELQALLVLLVRMGMHYEQQEQSLFLQSDCVRYPISYIETAPYPGFPTDLQSQLMAVLCRIPGESCICEKVFENRFATVQELRKMGAEIDVEGDRAKIRGVNVLHAAKLEAPDLRGGAALIIGALQAEGCSRIGKAEYIERGYEDVCRDLRQLGADIRADR